MKIMNSTVRCVLFNFTKQAFWFCTHQTKSSILIHCFVFFSLEIQYYSHFRQVHSKWFLICIFQAKVMNNRICKFASIFFFSLLFPKRSDCTYIRSDASRKFIDDEKWRSLMRCLSKKCCQRQHRKCHEFAF